MERYDSYKDSGVDWIGQIPEHWSIHRFKAIFTLNTGISFTKADLLENGQPVISYGQVHSKLNQVAKANLSLIKYIPQSLTIGKQKSYCLPNDFIFADTSEDFDGCGNNFYNDSELSVFAGSHTILAKLRCNIEGKYLAYLFSTSLWRQQIRSRVNGVKVFSINQSILKATSVILPPIAEQKAISSYLDMETGKLDAAVEKLERMVEVLKERKQLIISKAVTRGLDDSVPLKDSGVEWIGQIPQHWQKFRFKNLLQIKSKKSDSFFKVGLENIESQTGRFLSTSTLFDGDGIAFESGDILYGKLRPYLQKAWLANCSGSAVGDFFVYKVQPICVDRFMLYVLLSKQFTEVCTGATYGAKMPRVASEFISALPYFLPPIAEQQAIAAYLDEKVGKLDEAIEKQLRMIELLKERKQILISDVVTGKIKVA